MKDLGKLSTFLGIQFEQSIDSITMTQSLYLNSILQKFGFDQSKPRSTPCEMKPDTYNTDHADDKIDHKKYRQMVGRLVYAMTCTRPDLSYVVTKLSQHLSKLR